MNFRTAVKKNLAFFLLIIIFLIIKIFFMAQHHEFFWDESVYIGIGKFIFSGGDAGLWEPIRPPVLPLLLGAAWKTGLDITVLSEILILAFSAGLMIMTYLIACELFNRKTGLVSVFLIAFTPVFFKFSSLVMTGIPSTFFALSAIYFYIRKKSLFLVGLFAGLAFLTRFPQVLIIFSIAFLIIIQRIRETRNAKDDFIVLSRRLTNFSSGILVFLTPYLIFNYFMYRQQLVNVHHMIFRPFILAFEHQSNAWEAVNGLFYNYFFYFITLFQQNYLFVFAIAGILLALAVRKNRSVLLPLLVPLFFYIFYFSIILNKQARFSLAFLPIVAIFAAYGIIEVFRYALKSRALVKYTLVMIMLFAALFSYNSVIMEDWRIYYYLPSGPDIKVSEFYYGYIADLEEPIMTSDPTSLAYIDKLMIPIYSNNIEGPVMYEENKDRASTIIFHPDVYPCFPDDLECRKRNRAFFYTLMEENELLEVREYYGTEYYIFSRR